MTNKFESLDKFVQLSEADSKKFLGGEDPLADPTVHVIKNPTVNNTDTNSGLQRDSVSDTKTDSSTVLDDE